MVHGEGSDSRQPDDPTPAPEIPIPSRQAAQIRLDFDPFAEPDECGQLAMAEGFGGYASWRRARGLELLDAQLHAERLVRWRSKPRFLMVAVVTAAQAPLLALTLDDLQQQMYEDWCLAILSDQPSPSALFGSDPCLQWLQLPDLGDEETVVGILNALAAEAVFDWMALLPAGFRLEPNALLVLGDYIDRNPGWVAVYSDDDQVDADGEFSKPRFKPDFDIDFYRGYDYIGAALWLKTDAAHALGGFAPLGDAVGFEVLLRIWEVVGDQGIGHISQPLLHLPAEITQLKLDSPMLHAAVIAHLERAGLPATVGNGLEEGTRQIHWAWPRLPQVTVVIALRDGLEFLAPCLESILERTNYENFDILLVNNGSTDPDTIRWLADVGRAAAVSVSVIDLAGDFDLAACYNLAAERSSAEFLCFLGSDVEVVQDQWLARLVDVAQRPDVGAVGARIAEPETGRVLQAGLILGLEGLPAGAPFTGLSGLRDSGPLMRLQVVRGCAAVSAVCMLVRRSDYLSVGGLDAELTAAWADVDLCLRLRDRGLRVLWTPHSTLVHHNISKAERGESVAKRAKRLEGLVAARELMLERWLPQLASDPHYNRNLSLVNRDMRLEVSFRSAWDTSFRERKRVLGIPLAGGSGTYRVKEPFDALADFGRLHMMHPVVSPKGPRLLTALEVARLAPDSLLVHANLDDRCLSMLSENRRFNTVVFQLFALDDLITQIPEKSNVWTHFRRHIRDVRPRLREALCHCDRLVVSTAPLADLCRDMIDDVVVVPNRLSEVWRGHASQRNRTDRVRVGWVGALQHQGDLELIEDVVDRLSGEVDFVFMGMATDRIHPRLAEFHPPVPWEEYPAKVASLDLDIALAPLESIPFNEAKSNLRLLEYGVFGWPVVCTDIFPYQQDSAPVTRVPNEPEAWIEAIRALARDPEKRAREGDALQDWVLSRYMLVDHLDDWERALLR